MRSKSSLLLLLALPLAGCHSMNYAERGATLGAATGALTGAAIGKDSGNAGAGAVIGSAVGALTGAAVGDGIDADIARNNAIIQDRMGRQLAGVVTVDDVISMTEANLSDDVITTHIRANGVIQRPQPEDLITLTKNGVSDTVIKAMQTAPPPTPPQTSAPRSGPVIVEEHHYVTPPRPHWHYHGRHRPRRTGLHWGVSFGH